MLITIFTPTYNRADLLGRLYQSLCVQSYQDFEWVIVNDGSKDNTDDVVQSFRDEGKIKIKYIKQENGGKHRAINRGVREAKGELFFIADSDDWLPKNALQIVWDIYEPIRNNTTIAGVSGLDGFEDGRLVTSGLPKDFVDSTPGEILYKYGIVGDKKEVFRTNVLKEFPFPEIVGEKFCPEMLVWYRIATKYKIRYFNKPIYCVEYQEKGITDRIVKVREESPITSMLAYQAKLMSDIPTLYKIQSAINFYRFKACISPEHYKEVSKHGIEIPHLPWYWCWCKVFGDYFHFKDKRRS